MPSIETSSLADIRRQINRLMVNRNAAVQQIKTVQGNLDTMLGNEKSVQAAQEHMQSIAKEIQEKAHRQMATVVSRSLSAVFEEPYELRVEFVERRGKTEAEFVFLRNGRKVNPRTTSGGVREVTSLALRLAKMVLAMPPARRLLVLDEPFGGVSSSNLKKVAALIEALSEDLGVQFLICTHNDELKIGNVIEL